MTINEFIKKEKNNGKLVGYGLETRIKSLEESNKNSHELEKYQIYGFLESLFYTGYITENEYDDLFKDVQNLAREIFYKI